MPSLNYRNDIKTYYNLNSIYLIIFDQTFLLKYVYHNIFIYVYKYWFKNDQVK